MKGSSEVFHILEPRLPLTEEIGNFGAQGETRPRTLLNPTHRPLSSSVFMVYI